MLLDVVDQFTSVLTEILSIFRAELHADCR